MSDLERAARQALDALGRCSIRLNDLDFRESVLSAIDALRAALAQQAEPVSALTRYTEIVAEDPADDMGGALERLRFFCSLSMPGQDWLDVEPLFDAVEKEQAKPGLDAVLAEREACAALCADYAEWCREWGQDSNHTAAEAAANECAAAIRARGQQAEPVVDRAALFNELGEQMFPTMKLSGCSVCGIGAGKVMGYVCPRGDCPSKVTSGGAV